MSNGTTAPAEAKADIKAEVKKKLTVEFTPEELQTLDTLAGKLKRNRSNTIRWTLEQALKVELRKEKGEG